MFYEKLAGQSAIEYLMTYGWMLLVVAIVGGAIFSMVGDQSIESVQGFDANDIQVNEFGMTANSLQMSVESFGTDTVTLREIKFSDSDQSITIPLDNDIDIGDSRTLNIPHFRQIEGNNDIEVELTYDIGGLEAISTSGYISGGIGVDESLAGYWTFNEGQTNSTHVYDISGRANHGMHETTPVTGVESPAGEAYYIQEPEHCVMFPDSSGEDFFLLEDDNSWSIFYWGNLHFGDGEYYGMFVNQGSGGGTSRQWSMSQMSEGSESMRVSMRGNTYDSGMSEYYDQWHHYGFEWDGSEATIYVDGEVMAEGLTPGDNSPEGRETFGIGGRWHCTENEDQGAGKGQFSDLSLYDRALSEDEIQALYQNPGLIR